MCFDMVEHSFLCTGKNDNCGYVITDSKFSPSCDLRHLAMNRAIVTAGHTKTAESAALILKEGGNAFDAAIAALYTACIVEPALASLGGGGFLMAFPEQGKPVLLDFFTQTPSRHKSAKDIDAHSFLCDFGSTQQEFVIGPGTSAVPGCVKGIFETAERFSTMPMKELIQPALAVSDEGILITEMQAHIINILTPIYMSESARPIFESKLEPGTPVGSGEKIRFPDYADLLHSLAAEGVDLFYRGEVAQAVDGIAGRGGVITYQDMVDYQIELRTPLQIDYRNYTLLTNPPPSSGGFLISVGLGQLENRRVAQNGFGSFEHLNALLNNLKLCNELSEGGPNPGVAPQLINAYRSSIGEYRQSHRGTTHISIIDRHRNAVSVSVSNGEGCGTIIPGTSVMLNNMLGEDDVNPDGLDNWPLNERLSSMMSPTVAVGRDDSLIAAGSGGSNRIPAVIQQVLINLIDFGMSVENAVRAPRVHYHRGVAYAEDLFDAADLDSVLAGFDDAVRFPDRDVFFGGVHAAKVMGDRVEGFGDERRAGVALIV